MDEIKPDSVLDCEGLLCPMPVVKLKEAMKALKPGQVIMMTATDPGSKADIPAFARRTQNELLKMNETNGKFEYFLRRS